SVPLAPHRVSGTAPHRWCLTDCPCVLERGVTPTRAFPVRPALPADVQRVSCGVAPSKQMCLGVFTRPGDHPTDPFPTFNPSPFHVANRVGIRTPATRFQQPRLAHRSWRR